MKLSKHLGLAVCVWLLAHSSMAAAQDTSFVSVRIARSFDFWNLARSERDAVKGLVYLTKALDAVYELQTQTEPPADIMLSLTQQRKEMIALRDTLIHRLDDELEASMPALREAVNAHDLRRQLVIEERFVEVAQAVGEYGGHRSPAMERIGANASQSVRDLREKLGMSTSESERAASTVNQPPVTMPEPRDTTTAPTIGRDTPSQAADAQGVALEQNQHEAAAPLSAGDRFTRIAKAIVTVVLGFLVVILAINLCLLAWRLLRSAVIRNGFRYLWRAQLALVRQVFPKSVSQPKE